VGDGWLVVADPSRRSRAYELSAIYRQRTATEPNRDERLAEASCLHRFRDVVSCGIMWPQRKHRL